MDAAWERDTTAEVVLIEGVVPAATPVVTVEVETRFVVDSAVVETTTEELARPLVVPAPEVEERAPVVLAPAVVLSEPVVVDVASVVVEVAPRAAVDDRAVEVEGPAVEAEVVPKDVEDAVVVAWTGE